MLSSPMRRVFQSSYGTPAVLSLVDTPTPTPKAGEVLVRVHAACLNSWDWDRLTGKPRTWRLISGLFSPRQKFPGCDLAGTVEAVGPGVQRLKLGDAVMGDLSVGSHWGAFAECVVAPESILATLEPGLSFEDAACLPQAGMLALQSIRDALNIQAGQSLLISGAGGGVGTLALQMAKARGATVSVCDLPEKLPALLALGADEALPWPRPGCYNSGRTWDRVLDVNISAPVARYEQSLNPGGVHCIIGGSPGALFQYMLRARPRAKKRGRTLSMVAQKTTLEDLSLLMRLAVRGECKPVIDTVFPLDQATQAFEKFGRGDFVGKILLRPQVPQP